MRYLIFLLVLLFPLVAGAQHGPCPIITADGIMKETCDKIYNGDITFNGAVNIPGGITDPSAVKQTTGNLSLFVRTTGNDSNDCLSSGAACLTIQAAVNKIPHIISDGDAVSVDVGEGTFAAFSLTGTNIGAGSSLNIDGTLGLVTGLTGLNEGTADSSAPVDYHRSMTDAAGGWASDELIGKLLFCSSLYSPIITNTATVVEHVGQSSCSGAYQILDQKTIATGTGASGYSPIEVMNISAPTYTSFGISNFKITAAGVIGILLYDSPGEVLRCNATNQFYGFVVGQSARMTRIGDSFCGSSLVACFIVQRGGGVGNMGDEPPSIERSVALNSSGQGAGIVLGLTIIAGVKHVYAANSTVNGGLAILGASNAKVELSDFVDNKWGIVIDSENATLGETSDSHVIIENVNVSDNTLAGIIASEDSNILASNVEGSGNSIGVELKTGATFARGGTATTITGSTGDFTLNGSVTIMDWATYLGSSSDVVSNLENGCRARY